MPLEPLYNSTFSIPYTACGVLPYADQVVAKVTGVPHPGRVAVEDVHQGELGRGEAQLTDVLTTTRGLTSVHPPYPDTAVIGDRTEQLVSWVEGHGKDDSLKRS